MKKRTKLTTEKRKRERAGFSEFYREHTEVAAKTFCDNCGRKLSGNVSEIAHILPKNVFKSVATHPLNVLYLCSNLTYGTDGCHDLYDSSWSVAKMMNVWPTAVERYKHFKDDIEERIPKILNHFEEDGDT